LDLPIYTGVDREIQVGHVIRTEDYFIPKKNLEGSFSRKRPVERPQNRWEENVQKDFVFLLEIQNWKLVAQNRIRGRKLGWP
jgi:hypothetical protein